MSEPSPTPPGSTPPDERPPSGGSLVRWEGGSIPVSRLVQAAPDDLGHHLVLWVESGSERVVGVRFARSGTHDQVTEELLEESMQRPATGSPTQPAQVLVSDATLAASIRARVGSLGIQVRMVADCRSWNAVVTEFGAFLAAHWPGRSYLGGEDTTPAAVERFFGAAAAFYRRAPWLVLRETPIELRLAGRPGPLYAVVLGHDRVIHGLTLYLSEASFRRRSQRDPHPIRARGTVAVTFDREDGIPPPMLEERKAHRWELAGPAAFPLPYRQLADGTMREPNGEELDVLSLALHAVSALVERHGNRLINGPRTEEAVQVPGATGDSIARLAFPAGIDEPASD